MEDYLKVFIHSIVRNCRHVREVIVVKIDETNDHLIETWEECGIKFYLYGCSLFTEPPPFSAEFGQMVGGHALGMHRAMDYAKEKFIWMSDPDIFFLTELDRFYLELFERYDTNIVGVSHFNPTEQSYLCFPCAINCMVLRDRLPDFKWRKGELFVQSGMWLRDNCSLLHPVDGKYLIPGPLTNHCHEFPNPDGIFDMGCNLWLWNHELGGRWIGFQLDASCHPFQGNSGADDLVYPMNYSAKFYQSNFGLRDDLGDFDLLYHRTRGSKAGGPAFAELYHSLLD